jgi:hypothetical protein
MTGVKRPRRVRAPESDPQPQNPTALPGAATSLVRGLIRNGLLDEACRHALTMLDQRIVVGDVELSAVRILLQHYHIILSAQPPLSHVGMVPLRPDSRLYACFDQFLDLLHRQENQIAELQAMVAELV